MKNFTHPRKSRSAGYVDRSRRNEETRDDPSSDPQSSRTEERRSRSRKNESRKTQDKPTSSRERSKSRSNYNIRPQADEDRSRSGKIRSKLTSDNQRTTRRKEEENPKRNRNQRTENKYKDPSQRYFVKVTLPISNQSKLDTVLHFFPRLEKCCCCWSLRTGCIFIGWSQVVGCLVVGGLQFLIAMVCFEQLNLDDFFNNFPPDINPAKTVSDFADDFCAGLSLGYASGEAIGFGTGIMLLVAVSKDHVYLLKLWVYVAIMMLLPTMTFYGIAIYAIIECRNDVPVIAVPSTIELISFVILCYCTSVVKSYYYERIDYLLDIRLGEPIFLQEQGEKEAEV